MLSLSKHEVLTEPVDENLYTATKLGVPWEARVIE